VKETVGNVQVPIVNANQLVRPGDVIVADVDGVCVVRREDAVAVLAKGRKREANETAKRAGLKSGELGLDIYNMRDKLTAKGLAYQDYQQ
jgi:4-hydroxy-4-methyl-2-oxoglutarate aldolase